MREGQARPPTAGRDPQLVLSDAIQEWEATAAVGQARDTACMKLQATIVISYRADSFGDAGDALDDVLQRARERDDVEIDSIQLGTPASAGPVTLPYVERPPAPPRRVPHPLPDGDRN
jgi:hypothetical protein